MSMHCFDTEIAKELGLIEGIVYHHICFWTNNNTKAKRNKREGKHWTYSSIREIAVTLNYLTQKQIRTAIDNLVKAGKILKANYSRGKRTNWYHAVDAIKYFKRLQEAEDSNEIGAEPFAPEGETTIAPEGKSITDIKPDIKTSSIEVAEVDNLFEEVWKIYPKDRCRYPERTKKAYRKLVQNGADPDTILSALKLYASKSINHSRWTVSYSDNWFAQARYREQIVSLSERKDKLKPLTTEQIQLRIDWLNTGGKMAKSIPQDQLDQIIASGMWSPPEGWLGRKAA